MSVTEYDSAYLPGTAQRMGQNPMLPLHPVTAHYDSVYAAQEAQLRAQTAKKHADILKQLGYVDESGQFIPGSVSVKAQRQASDLKREEGDAVQNVNDTAQRGNAWFSGRRAEDIGKAELPYETELARLGVDTATQLMGLHRDASGLIDDYTRQNNVNLANMAARQAQGITENPADDGTAAAGGQLALPTGPAAQARARTAQQKGWISPTPTLNFAAPPPPGGIRQAQRAGSQMRRMY